VDKPAEPFVQALQLDADVAKGKAEFQQRCSQCHGKNGWGSYDGEFPQLAGQLRSVIIKQLVDIHRGTRSNPKMISVGFQLSSKPSQLIADIAGYLETVLMNPEPEVGDDLEVAESVY
jgi:cytochrome c553